jgi:predicted DNA-binding antitoxin AbrB/MazE fold protein
MATLVKAVFEHGAFVPETPCDLPDGSRVVLAIERLDNVRPPEEDNPEERKRILREVVESMQRNPVPRDSPRFTRDELHERH